MIEQFRMRRLLAEHSEVIDRLNETSAKQMVPDTVHGDSRHKRICFRVDQPQREL